MPQVGGCVRGTHVFLREANDIPTSRTTDKIWYENNSSIELLTRGLYSIQVMTCRNSRSRSLLAIPLPARSRTLALTRLRHLPEHSLTQALLIIVARMDTNNMAQRKTNGASEMSMHRVSAHEKLEEMLRLLSRLLFLVLSLLYSQPVVVAGNTDYDGRTQAMIQVPKGNYVTGEGCERR